MRVQAGTEKRRSNRTEKHDGRGRQVGTEGVVTSVTHKDETRADITDISGFFRSINYRGLVIVLRQCLCQHSRSIILSARTRLDDLQILLCLRNKYFPAQVR